MLNEEYGKEKAREIRADYERRAEERREEETSWRLCARMTAGDQFVTAMPGGAITENAKTYYWEERTAFNHLATILETRLARLARVKPKLNLRSSEGDEQHSLAAKISAAIVENACERTELDRLIDEATMWSELTGTAFYKLSWDCGAGMTVGKIGDRDIKEGDVRIDVCPPYEIFPDSTACRSVADCRSIIHAKSLPTEEIKRLWGADVKPDKQSPSGADGAEASGAAKKGYALVIERYTRPDENFPRGRYEVAAGDCLLFEGDLPFAVDKGGKAGLPFVRQRSIPRAGRFYGMCPVRRAVPVQRAYNAVKNRKHEFMNRIAAGVLAVEDGSVDTAELEEEGLAPGKIVVYAAGSRPPEFINPGSIPDDFDKEEQNLLREFASVSGVSEFMSASTVPSSVSSGSALEMLIEQDDSRLSVSAGEICTAVKEIGRMILRLYRQFAASARLSRVAGGTGGSETVAWDARSLSDDEVIIETDTRLSDSVTARRNTVLKLLAAGLLGGENGKIDAKTRGTILQSFGFAGADQGDNLAEIQRMRAHRENAAIARGESVRVKTYDDHSAHIEAHTLFALTADAGEEAADLLERHIAEHEELMKKEEKK